MPVFQWLYFDALECLPEEDADSILSEESCKPVSVKKCISSLCENFLSLEEHFRYFVSYLHPFGSP